MKMLFNETRTTQSHFVTLKKTLQIGGVCNPFLSALLKKHTLKLNFFKSTRHLLFVYALLPLQAKLPRSQSIVSDNETRYYYIYFPIHCQVFFVINWSFFRFIACLQTLNMKQLCLYPQIKTQKSLKLVYFQKKDKPILNHLQDLFLGQNRNAQSPRLVKFTSRFLASDDIRGVFGDG